MRKLAISRSQLRVVADQQGGPTAAADIASGILHIAAAIKAASTARGIYHFSGAPAVTWYEFAKAILSDRLDLEVHGIGSEEWPTSAPRPKNSVLDGSCLLRDFGLAQPDWRLALQNVLARLASDDRT